MATAIQTPQFYRHVVIFANVHLNHINGEFRPVWVGIENLNAEYTLTSSIKLFLQQIGGPWKPSAVFLADNTATNPAHYFLRSKLVEYIASGGIVFLGGLLPSESKQEDINSLFYAFGLPWICGKDTDPDEEPVNVWITAECRPMCGKPMLPAKHEINGLFLRGVPIGARLYVERKKRDPTYVVDNGVDAPQTIAAFQRVGAGWVGYLGDCEAADTSESMAIMTAMLGLWKDQSIPTCALCGKNGAALAGMGSVHCGVCQRTHWCDTECAEKDKPRHMIVCGKEQLFEVMVSPGVAANPGPGLPGYQPHVVGQHGHQTHVVGQQGHQPHVIGHQGQH